MKDLPTSGTRSCAVRNHPPRRKRKTWPLADYLLLCVAGAIREPILYLSLHLKGNRQKYYELLDRVRTHGEWETWLEFFLAGVKETAQQTADTSREILALIDNDHRKIEQLGRPASSVLRVHQHLKRKPIIKIPATAEQLSPSGPTVAKALQHMVKLGIVRETTGKQRHRLFTYHRYLEILNQGTELPRPNLGKKQ
jgi:Fic family protein